MRLAWLLGLALMGCAHESATLLARTYEYGKVHRPYTGIPPYLCQSPPPLPPGSQCDGRPPAQTPPEPPPQ
jgi:hypothetical protein